MAESAGATCTVSVLTDVTMAHSICPLTCTAMSVPGRKREPWPLATSNCVEDVPVATVEPAAAYSCPSAWRSQRRGVSDAGEPAETSCDALGVCLSSIDAENLDAISRP